jgi:hypothetical protein
MYLLFGRAPANLDLDSEQEWIEVLGRLTGSIEEEMRKFRLDEEATSLIKNALPVSDPVIKTALHLLLSFATFSGFTVTVQVVVQQRVPDDLLKKWQSTDLLRRPWGGKGIVESWLWSIERRDVYQSGRGSFEVPFGFAPGIETPQKLGQNIRQLCV